jgi:hypothetical protein
MNFKKFKVLSTNENHLQGSEEQTMLINLDHIISIKPIRINTADQLIDGYWIRTSNAKKYKATVIPAELDTVLQAPFKTQIKTVNFEETVIQ